MHKTEERVDPANSENPLGLQAAIKAYIEKNNRKLGSVDIVAHFKLRADITLKEVKRLEEQGITRRVWNGRIYVYEC